MQGDDRVRHCGQCDQSVYNLISMHEDEIHTLLAQHEQMPCLRLYRRRDGTIITQDQCSYTPVKLNLPLRGFVPLAAALILAGCAQQPSYSSKSLMHIFHHDAEYNTQPTGGAPVPVPPEKAVKS
jgi:hypothetical protein